MSDTDVFRMARHPRLLQQNRSGSRQISRCLSSPPLRQRTLVIGWPEAEPQRARRRRQSCGSRLVARVAKPELLKKP